MTPSDSIPPGARRPHGPPPSSPLAHPDQIGPYRILHVLGEGGMGVVYEAEQVEPVVRRVAVKVIKVGMDTRQVVARFEAERQALAVMDHPSIAKVLDAGATEQGRPYFVMELVEGIPIDEYGDRHRLATDARLTLVMRLCSAVQHAHQKGVIHRDLKPSNVLVVDVDGEPIPKVIDFGIAKAVGLRLTDKTLVTQQGGILGTPLYMSPEQLDASGLDVDTRTDIYAMGVILYQLLVGAMPYDPRDLMQPEHAVLQMLRTTEPPSPSARLSTLGDVGHEVAALRDTDAVALRRELRGDLDWITMKAMAKDRQRRYEAASELAQDIRRYLEREPVNARPPSAAYRLTRFVQRHRAAVVTMTVVVAALLGGAVVASLGMVRAIRAEARAQDEAESAREVSEFLVSLFEVSDPTESRSNAITARELLDRGADRITVELTDRPVAQAQMMETIGRVYRNLGLYRQASPLLGRSLSIRDSVHGSEHPDVAASLEQLGLLQSAEAQFTAARTSFRRALDIRRREGQPAPETEARLLSHLAEVAWRAGQYDSAKALASRALDLRERSAGPTDPTVAESLRQLGVVHANMGEWDMALAHYERALPILEAGYGTDHLEVASLRESIALVLDTQGDKDSALAIHREVLAVRERRLGEDHPSIAFSLHNMGRVLADLGEGDSARTLYERAVVIRERVHGPDHPQVSYALESLAILIAQSGDLARARPLFERALTINETALGAEHPETLESLQNLAILVAFEGDPTRAIRLLRTAVDRGYADAGVLESEVFASLRGRPAFEAIRAEVTGR